METREKILQAARQQFERGGYVGTTTKAIAAEAGVSEMTLFRYFKTKENLFRAVVQQITAPADLAGMKQQLADGGQQALTEIAVQLLRYFSAHRAMIRMMLFESMERPALREIIGEMPRRSGAALYTCFKKQMEAGILRQEDPAILVKAFLGMLLGYAVGLQSLEAEGEEACRRFAEESTAIFWRGIVKEDGQ